MKIEINSIPETMLNRNAQSSIAKITPPTSESSSAVEVAKNPVQPSTLSMNEMRQTIDKATGLIQTIVSDKLSEEVIRKMPADEYLEMLSLLDGMINGSVDSDI